MSRQSYQRLAGDGSSAASAAATSSSRAGGAPIASPVSSSSARSSATSPREADKHRARSNVGGDDDAQAPWLTHLEYSVDPLSEWEADDKHRACPLCKAAFVATMMGSGRHHCRMCGILCCGNCSKGSLDLPGYDQGKERVCQPCNKSVGALRSFLKSNDEVLLNNYSSINREAVEFTLYHRGAAGYTTEIWLSQSLLMVMYRSGNGESFEGVPVSMIESVTTGFSTKELKERRTKTVMCCVTSQDDVFAKKEPLLFSLVLADGRTLDFEAPSGSARNEWADRLRSLATVAGPFVKYHFAVARYSVSDLVKREQERLSSKNIAKLRSQQKQAERSQQNVKSNAIREKYAKKRGQ